MSAFNLTSAAFIPFWGQTCDIFGRYAALQASVILMLVGSALCTAAPTSAYPVLLLGRALQGLGAAGVNVGVRVVLADRASLAENAKNWTIFSTTAGISYGLGPVIGGYLTDAHWRWCFGINLPVGVLAVVGIWLLLRRELLGPQPLPELDEASGNGTAYTRRTRFAARLATVDVGGQVLFMLGFGLLVLAFTWAGGEHPWNSAAVLVPLCSGALVTVAFVLWERAMSPGGWLVQRSDRLRRQRPMIPWNIMADLNIGLSFYIAFATGFAMFAVLCKSPR